MTTAALLATVVMALVAIAALLYTALQFSSNARAKDIEKARGPLLQEIRELRSDLADVKKENSYLRRRVDELSDELRRR